VKFATWPRGTRVPVAKGQRWSPLNRIGTGVSFLLPHVQHGKTKLLVLFSDRRSPQAPDVPTAKEAGHPELTFRSVAGFYGWRDIRPEHMDRIAADVRAVANLPSVHRGDAVSARTVVHHHRLMPSLYRPSANMRASRSMEMPGGSGTMTRTGRSTMRLALLGSMPIASARRRWSIPGSSSRQSSVPYSNSVQRGPALSLCYRYSCTSRPRCKFHLF
jgi:hypothetical protein